MKKVFDSLFIICGVVFGLSLSACEEIFGEGYWEDGHYIGSQNSDYDDYDDEEDRLVVSGEGETILLKYNNLTFTAQLNWDDGNYYFAPDRDGSVSGHRSTCVASIDDQSVEGNCFRDGKVCHFTYYDSWSDGDEGDVYYLNSTTCKTAASVGPFLVPLDSPLCGEDPYPECPDDDLFPTGPTNDADDNGGSDSSDEDSDQSEDPRQSIPAEIGGGDDAELPSPIEVGDSTVTSLFVDALCQAASRCDGTIDESQCVARMNCEEGRQIWDNLGLEDKENNLSTAEVNEGLAYGTVTANLSALSECLLELSETCDNGETVEIGSYLNIENIISEDGDCPQVLSFVP